MTRVAAYYRISSDPKGLAEGVDRQEADCRARADREGWRDLYEVRENDTGASRYSRKARPRYAEMLRRAWAGEFDVILAYSMSRLTRAPRELEDLIDLAEKTDVRIVTLNSFDYDLNTGNGRYFARQEAARDANEADLISERVRRQKQAKQERYGFSSGTRPFGFHAPTQGDETLRVNDTEADMIRAGAERVIGGGSVASLVRDWNDSGTTGVRGKQWRRDTVRKVLLAERNVPAILDETTAATVRGILNDNSRQYARGNTPAHLLTGVAVCGVCGGRIGYRRMSGGHPGYGCEASPGHNTMRKAQADKVVGLAVAQWYAMDRVDLAEESTGARTVEAVQAERSALVNERNEIEADVAAKIRTRAGTRAELVEIRDRLDALDAELRTILQSDAHEAIHEAVRQAEGILADAATRERKSSISRAVTVLRQWEAMDITAQRKLLKASFTIRILDAKTAGGYGGKRVRVSRNGLDLTRADEEV